MRTTYSDVEWISEDSTYVAATPVMRNLRAQAELLARVNVPVLIAGENGSGKKLTARLIHHLSNRAAAPFVLINCGAFEADVLQGDTLGGRGAAAGTASRPEELEPPRDGTLLLDHVTELPMRLQAKLLMLMQEGSMRDTVSSLNCRILATSAIALDRAFVQKKLRDELYYRLTAFTIHVPPLRERLGEIHLLLAYFMGRAARQYNLEPRALSDALVEACGEYDWPGNLRELESFVQRFLVIGNEESVISELRQRAGAAATTRENSPAVPSEKCPEEGVNSLKTLVRSVKGDAEKSAILDALEKTRWNRKEAARLLGISYRGILYKIEEYQLTRPTVWHVWKEPSPNDHDGPVSRNSIKL